MGLFDFLFGGKQPSRIEVSPDHIWLTARAKYKGVAKEVKERCESQSVAILLVAHFASELEEASKIAKEQALGTPLMAVLASQLTPELAVDLGFSETDVVDFIMVERHPVPATDDQFKEFVSELPCRSFLSYHVSLDDPMLAVFAGDWVRETLEGLGMNEDESIESRMVSRRIRKAQEKVDKLKIGESECQSAQEWFEKNCPSLLPESD